MFEPRHDQSLTALHMAAQHPETNATITKLRAAGISWAQILAVLAQMLPAILSGNFSAVIAALLALLPPLPPLPPLPIPPAPPVPAHP